MRNFCLCLWFVLVAISAQLTAAQSIIGAAKQVGSITDQGGGIQDVTFDLVVENLGTTSLSGVQLTDDLSTSFPAPATFSIIAGPSATGTLVANGGFDGIGDIELLSSGSSSLAIGAIGSVSFTVRVNPNGPGGLYSNRAFASATSPELVSDFSDDGSDPDPNGNADPSDAGEDDPTPITLTPVELLEFAID